MIQIIYQNIKTGQMHNITTIVSAAKWNTKRSGSPATFEFSVIKDTKVQWEHGSIVTVKDDEKGIFYGYVFKYSVKENGERSVTAYDQTRYLKNKRFYEFEDKRADEIALEIAQDFAIKTGEMANTGHVIAYMCKDSKCLFDIILEALDSTLVNTNKMYFLWDDFGLLRISDCESHELGIVIGDASLMTGFTYQSDIDSETYNVIQFYREDKEAGKRKELEPVIGEENVRQWGILQRVEKADDAQNDAQIHEKAKKMLELYNRPKQSFDITAIADLSVRAGHWVHIRIEDLQITQPYIVEEVSHDLLKQEMTLKLKVV